MNTTFKTLAAAAALCALQAQAATFTASLTAGPSTGVAGAIVETFDSLATGALNGGTVYSWTQGSLTGDNIYLLSGVSAQPKQGPNPVQDQWFSVAGGQTATFNLAAGTTYVGFLWGSVDTYNSVSFYDGANLIATYVGGSNGFPFEVPVGNGNQGASQYFNFSVLTGSISSVTFSSGSNAFEIDNLATVAVPEPETYALMLAGLAAVGFMSRRRSAR